MPATYAALACEERTPRHGSALKAKLHLPSQPPRGIAMEKASSAAAREAEAALRWASMEDQLETLRHFLRLRGCMYRYSRRHVRGQRANTRSLTANDTVVARVKKAAAAYRRHRKAYVALKGKGEWEVSREWENGRMGGCIPLLELFLLDWEGM